MFDIFNFTRADTNINTFREYLIAKQSPPNLSISNCIIHLRNSRIFCVVLKQYYNRVWLKTDKEKNVSLSPEIKKEAIKHWIIKKIYFFLQYNK